MKSIGFITSIGKDAVKLKPCLPFPESSPNDSGFLLGSTSPTICKLWEIHEFTILYNMGSHLETMNTLMSGIQESISSMGESIRIIEDLMDEILEELDYLVGYNNTDDSFDYIEESIDMETDKVQGG